MDLMKLPLKQLLAMRDELRAMAPKPHYGISDAKVKELAQLGNEYHAAMRRVLAARKAGDEQALGEARAAAERLRDRVARGSHVRIDGESGYKVKQALAGVYEFSRSTSSSLGHGPDA